MLLKQTLTVLDVLDDGFVDGEKVVALFEGFEYVDGHTEVIGDDEGKTHFVRFLIKGTKGRSAGGDAPTLGIIGRLGGVGARTCRFHGGPY